MASPGATILVLFSIVAASLWLGASAQSSSGCTNVMISLSPCLNYITGNSSIPSSNCCSQLSNVVKLQPQCLCQVLNGGSSPLGITINQTQAMALPGACRVQTPSASLCNNAASPTESQTPAVPSGTSDTVPSTEGDGSSSDGSSIKLSLPLFCMLLYTATYTSALSIY